MTSKYSTEATALTALIKNKKPDCVDALERGFWQARGEGLGIRESSEKAELLHFIHDHDGLNHGGELDDDVTTDEQVYAHLEKIAAEAVELGDNADEVSTMNDTFRYWYDLYRSWGGDVFLSYTGASTTSKAIYEEAHDLDEAEAITKINEVPSERLKDLILREFYSQRNGGETVIESLRRAQGKAEETLFTEMLFSALGGGNVLGGGFSS
jgi:hypothetical protein